MICSKSSPEAGPHHPRSPSPGGCGDKLSNPPPSLPKLSSPLQQISFSSLSPFLSPSHSLPAHVGIILQQLISQLGSTQGSPSVFLFPSSVFASCFIFSSIIHAFGDERICVSGENVLNLTFKCVCICRRLNTLNKCALMRLEISPQRKRVSAHAHTLPPLLPEKPLLHVSSTTIAFAHLNHQFTYGHSAKLLFLSSCLMRRHLLGLFLYQVGCEDPRGKEGSFNV